MFPDEPTDEERQQELPQDNGTPFQPAAPSPDPTAASDPVNQASAAVNLDDTHPVTDTNVQPEEQYDEDVSGAAEAGEPNADTAVTGFIPPADPAADETTDATAAAGDNSDTTPPTVL